MKAIISLFMACVFVLSASVQAQLLPNNKTLNAQSVQRWMQTNRDIAPIVQVVDEMNPTDDAIKAFEALPALEQDEKINAFLKEKNLADTANVIIARHGWKSVGEYMRLSTKLGNAIAAYFLLGDLGRVNEEQKKALREKADPAVLAVPESDIAFVKSNEKTLQQYIQAYAAGR